MSIKQDIGIYLISYALDAATDPHPDKDFTLRALDILAESLQKVDDNLTEIQNVIVMAAGKFALVAVLSGATSESYIEEASRAFNEILDIVGI